MSYYSLKFVKKSDQLPYKKLRDFLSFDGEAECSNIYYMDILDESADSKETLMQVAEELLKEFKSQQEYTVLIGDGKTYQHLMKIKEMYPAALKKLLIFPGDWHTLMNFQPVLMKKYWECGLMQLAQVAGFRGETLRALLKCSHFKRTHNFLIQVWEAVYLEMLGAFHSSDSFRIS